MLSQILQECLCPRIGQVESCSECYLSEIIEFEIKACEIACVAIVDEIEIVGYA